MRRITFAFFPFLLCSCASLERSIGLGAGIGLSTGITAAQLSHYNTKGNVVLGLSGVVLGGAIGALLYKSPPKALPSLTPSALPTTQPPLAGAERDVLLVPDKIEGDRYIEKHRIWTIKNPAHWQLREGQPKEADDEGENSNENGE